MLFTFDTHTRIGRVTGGGWNVTYEGHQSPVSAWMAANADGFLLAPGESLSAAGSKWVATVER